MKYGNSLYVAKRKHSPDSKVVKIRTDKSLGGLKTFIVCAVILSQLAILIALYIWLGLAFQWYLVFSFAMSLVTCIYVLSSKRNGLSKCVWIMLLLLGFCFGYIVYFLSDERFFFRKAKKKYREIYGRADRYTELSVPEQATPCVRRDCNYLWNAGKFQAYRNTRVTYFSSGASLFDDVLSRIERAETFIFIEFFIVSDGVLLNRTFDLLQEKVKKGVDVRIIYDDMGSHGTFSSAMKKKIKGAGIKLQPFNRLLPRFSVALNFRDHRKLVIVDGKTAYTGGSNLADEYVNEKRMYGYWKDTGIRLDGQAVDGFSLIFLRQWEFLTGQSEDYARFFGRSEPYASQSVVVPYADGLDFALPIGKNVYENIISGANERLWIMTPYFVPDDTVINLLINRATAGVDVRIVLPGVPDKAFVYAVSRNNAEKLIEHGVKVYCMKNAFVHSKIVLSENCCVVGSINVDLRSFYQQFESAVYTDDASVSAQVNEDFERVFLCSERITWENGKRKYRINRIFAGIMQIFAPFM